MFVFSSHTRPAHSETSTAALTTPALDRRSLRWFGISAPTATPEDLPPSLAQHRSCRRSSTSSSLPFRTHAGDGNSAMVVDLPRCGPMLIRRVPNLVPIPGITGSAHCALRPLQGPRDHRLAPPTRRAAPTGRPTRDHRRRPELARSDRGRATATEPSRVAGHRRHAVGLAPPPHRRALDSTTATAGPAIDLSRSFADSRCASQPRHPTWRYRRVHGELAGLGHTIAASTIWQILNNAGIDPAPTRSKVTWLFGNERGVGPRWRGWGPPESGVTSTESVEAPGGGEPYALILMVCSRRVWF